MHLLSLLGAAALPLAHALLPPTPNAAGTAACADLTKLLGSKKVVSSPFSPAYEESKNGYWNTAASQKSPACVTYPTNAQDVSTIIKAVRAADARFAFKAGGHNFNDNFSAVDGGVLIHARDMTQNTYDPVTTLGSYQPGTQFQPIYSFFAKHGRTITGPRLSTVGSGLTLGGGLSYLSGQYGLAADGFRELEVVLPSGDIVTASENSEPDLFFALKGGGGNAYGIVTNYTVQTRPTGKVFSGNIIYYANQTLAIAQALSDFAEYNTDPKAAIIGTYEKLPTPDLGLNLDEAVLLFIVYDGEDPGNAYANFTRLPHILDTTSVGDYNRAVNLPVPMITEIAEGGNIFRNTVLRIDGGKSFADAAAKMRAWAAANKGSYDLLSLDFQPVPKSLTDASHAQGGNAMDMPDGPYYWLCWLIRTVEIAPPSAVNGALSSFADMVASVPNAPGLPLFINDAHWDQHPLKTFSTYSRLQQIKAKYDPDNFFATHTGGWNFNA